MKAIIMAGGEGTRLRPVSLNAPKPMVRLFDRPVLEHTLDLLKKHDIYDACLTLRFLPQTITDHFGDGSRFGMRLTHQIEDSPLGTAGSVAACREFIGDEPILILSGDSVCDFDLTKCIAFHHAVRADVTIVLYAHPEPLEYGLVMTDEIGKVERFIEKPPWNQVFTNRINTGIYILSPQVLDEIPDGVSFDFSKDLFPKLLADGKRLYATEVRGYWCDIGSPEAYLQCGIDVLEENCTLDFGVARRGQSLWTHSPIPPGVDLLGPCYVGKDVVLETGASLGPHAIIGAGSHIAAGASVVRSMVDGATVGRDARLDGTIVGRGTSIRQGVILYEGSVIGDGTILGEGSVVSPKVRIWPGKELPAGSRVTENLVTGQPRSGLRFTGGNTIRGEASTLITPEACFAIGSALGTTGRVGIGSSGDPAARLTSRALTCGVSAAGGFALELDCTFESAASFSADLYGLDRTAFVRQLDQSLHLRVYGARGLTLTRDEERSIESTLRAGDLRRSPGTRVGDMTAASSSIEAYVSAAATWGDLGTAPTFAAHIHGSGGANRALKRALEQMGVSLATHSWGVPVFETARGGMTLRAEDEEGHKLETEHLLAILVMLEFEAGAKAVAVPYTAPIALDLLAGSFGGKILRIGRDQGAEQLYYRRPYLRDGVFAACRLVGTMAASGESLHEISSRAPSFQTAQRELAIKGNRAAIMQEFAAGLDKEEAELVQGVRLPASGGWVHISPASGRSVLKIHSEGMSMEAAEEICIDFAKRLEALDTKTPGS